MLNSFTSYTEQYYEFIIKASSEKFLSIILCNVTCMAVQTDQNGPLTLNAGWSLLRRMHSRILARGKSKLLMKSKPTSRYIVASSFFIYEIIALVYKNVSCTRIAELHCATDTQPILFNENNLQCSVETINAVE